MSRPSASWARAGRTLAGWALTALGFLAAWFALVGPDRLNHLTLDQFFRIPLEGLVLVAVAIALSSRTRTILAAVAGGLLGLLLLIRVLDLGFYEALDRPFNPVTDWAYVGPAVGLLRDSVGSVRAAIAEIGVVVLIVGILVLLPLAVIRLTGLAARHRLNSARTLVALGLIWLVLAAFGVRTGGRSPLASAGAAGLAAAQVEAVHSAVKDERSFNSALSATDPYAITPGGKLLTGLRGKDVIIAVVESYGQVAVQGTPFSTGVDAVLNAGTTELDAAGFQSRSAFLTSPTFGGISWLAHSTLQSGLWIDNQQRYDNLVASGRFTLSDAFKRAGWRTVGDVPSNTGPWPEGTSFYHYDQLYNEHNVGYVGPKFSYAAMPDQYTLSAFRSLELSKPDRKPVMAEIDLVSSHTPWTPLPHMVDPAQVGDGSIFIGMPEAGTAPDQVWPNANRVRAAYGRSIQYSLTSLISFVQSSHDDNLVMVVYGDHQPATIVSGSSANHNVPVTIIAHDPKVLSQISSWGWQDGMLPDPQAPVWPMDAFRDRFLSAYGGPPR
jgi:hypothetical protein